MVVVEGEFVVGVVVVELGTVGFFVWVVVMFGNGFGFLLVIHWYWVLITIYRVDIMFQLDVFINQ